MTEPTDTNQASEDELDEQIRLLLQDAMGDFPTEHLLEYHTNNFKQAIQAIIHTEKLKLLAEVRERVVGEDEKLVIPDYPKTDDEGEPLYSKRAAKEGRKQVTARYHTRKELRKKQRTELTKLEAEL